MPKPRSPRPKLARGDSHHGQSIHGRQLAEIEKEEQATQQPEYSWIDELERKTEQPVDESKLPAPVRATREYIRLFEARKAAHPERYITSFGSGSSDREAEQSIDIPLESKPDRPKQEPPKLTSDPAPSIVFVRNV